jgi:uncharacterized iron-regulated protein
MWRSFKSQDRKTPGGRAIGLAATCALFAAFTWVMEGCAVPVKPEVKEAAVARPDGGTIISGRTGAPVSWEEMQADLETVRIVYVGEHHTAAAQHEVQLGVIRALHARDARLVVGMEMFDRSYQAVLDDWSAGDLSEDLFLRRTHWYANWRFDFGLYRDILQFVKASHIRLVALNLPFCIPPKIRVGGIEYLSPYEKSFLPAEVDTTVVAHREYSRKIFEMHDFKTNVRFEDFYLAQCVWEDVMAESVAEALGADRMVVLAGNGHIQYKYGIPERAFKRNGLPYRTIYQASAQEELDPSIADYIVVPP